MRLPYDVAARMYITHAKNLVIHLCGYNSLAAPWGRIVVIEDLRTAAGNNQLNFVQQI